MSMENYNLNVAIVEDHLMVANLIRSNIISISDKINCTVFNEAKPLYTFLDSNTLDFLFLDVFMGDDNGLEILKKCRLNYTKENMKIIMLSSCKEPRIISDAIKFGANGFITKNDTVKEIEAAFDYLMHNPAKPYFSKNAADSLLGEKFNENEVKALSPREEQLLELICQGRTAKEMASDLELSVNTINYYTKRLMNKMGVNRTPDLIIKALADKSGKKYP
jgi:DNA-binding NarL/FixJ family response regulator